MITKELTVSSPVGFHARPAAVFVKEASSFKSEITIKYNDKEMNAKSMLGVLSLGMQSGQPVTLVFNGEDEATAAARIEKFFVEELPNM
jgi:phosphocarrier protein